MQQNPENTVDCKNPRNSSKLLTKQPSMFQICVLFGTFIGSHTHSTIHTIIVSGDQSHEAWEEGEGVARSGLELETLTQGHKGCILLGKAVQVPISNSNIAARRLTL